MADRELGHHDGTATAYADLKADGHWDVRLTDADGDGSADAATDLG
jgi:hypothetical protein